MLDTLVAYLVARGQAPLAGYLVAFCREYGGRVGGLGVLLVLAGLGAGLAWARAGEPAPPRPGRSTRALCCVAAALGSWAFHQAVLGPMPHEPDEATYLFEARLLAAGRAAAPDPGPEVRGLVDMPFTAAEDGRWFGAFPPAWPALLALAAPLGATWLLGPLLLAANLWLIGLWVEDQAGPELATAAVALGACSPFLLVLHGTLMADPLGLFLLLLALRAAESGRPSAAALAGGLSVATRPACVFAAGPILAWALATGGLAPGRDGPLVRLVRGLAGLAVPVALLLAWNAAATGSAWRSPYLAAAPRVGPGGVAYQGQEVLHDGVSAAVNLGLNLAAASVDLWGLAGLSLVPVLLGLSAAWARRGPGPWVGLGLLVGYGLYFHPGIAYGPRFYLPALPWVLLAAAAGLQGLLSLVGRGLEGGLPRVVLALLPAVVLSWGAPAAGQLARHAGIDPRPLEVADARMPAGGRLVVFVPAVGYPDRPLDRAFLGRADPWLGADRIYLRDPGTPEARARLAAALGREAWLLPWP